MGSSMNTNTKYNNKITSPTNSTAAAVASTTLNYVYILVIFGLLISLLLIVIVFENVIPSMRQSIMHPVFGFAIAIFIIWQISDFIGKKDKFFGYTFEKGKVVYVSIILLIFFVLGL